MKIALLLTNIKSLSFAADSAVRRIGGSVFMSSSISSIKLPPSIEELAVDWCYLTRELVHLELPSNIKHLKYVDGNYLIGGDQFDTLLFVRRNFEGKFVVPSGIKKIGNSAFYGCTKLTSVSYASPCVIEKFDMYAFCECSSLTSIQDVPPTLTEVDNQCFMDATSLSDIKFLGENVVLGDNSFYQCYQLKNVSFPNAKHVTIGIEAFHDAEDVNVVTPPGVTAEYRKPIVQDYSD